MKRLNLLLLTMLACFGSAWAVDVCVWTLNNQDKIIKCVNKQTGASIDVGEIDGWEYNFTADEGLYEFSMYASDGETFLGAKDIEVTEGMNTIMFYIGTYRVKNTNEDGSAWVEGEDYTISIGMETTGGDPVNFRHGRNSSGQITVLTQNTCRIYGTTTPSEAHQAEGYLEYYKLSAVNNNSTLDLTMPKGVVVNVTVPADVNLQIGRKVTHYVDFTLYEPFEQVVNGDTKTLSYKVLPSTTINFRAMREGSLTRAGYFSSSSDETTTTDIEITEAEFEAFDPKAYNQNPKSNQGYETGDIFVNGNERGHVELAVGETFEAHAMRTWELTDTSTANYFMEPDFHYTILGLDGQPLEGVLEVTSKPGSAWADIKGVAPGTAIVLVTYDAIGVHYLSGSNMTRTAFMGGEIWGAIWPENTAAYVVTVGQQTSNVTPNMIVNEEYNTGTLKVAGKYVDAEHDVFYYLATEEGYNYTFTPENVADITMAYPEIGEQMAVYNGFTSDGVTKNDDGSWTLLLKHGRQIVKMTDANGNATYQVIRARKAHREIVNVTRPGSHIYQPGDQVKIQYSGLFHPANKLAGIYNMSAYVTYNGVPNGTSLILSSNQYAFGSSSAAQAVTVDIPLDFDTENTSEISLTEGVLQVNGFGDPIGNHRLTDREKGRSANFAAMSHKTYFGAIPDASFAVTPYKSFKINVVPNVNGVEYTISFNGETLTADANGMYEGSYGTYEVTAKKAGYYCLHETYNIPDDAEGVQTFNINMTVTPEGAWDGVSMSRPQTENGSYYITTGAELAWFANQVNTSDEAANAVLGADIELADYDWTPIGTTALPYKSTFDGQGHIIKGLYINNPDAQTQGLFGILGNNAYVSNLAVDGHVFGGDYSGTVVGQVGTDALVDRCVNYASITGTKYPGGVAGYLFIGSKMTNCVNYGTVTGSTNAAGLAGLTNTAVMENLLNLGEVVCSSNASALAGRFAGSTATNVFAVRGYDVTEGYTVASDEQFASGEIAHILGEAFGQKLGEDAYPVIGGVKVYKVQYTLIDDAAIMPLDDDTDDEATSDLPAIYTNGDLPAELNGEEAHWFADAEMTTAVAEVNNDVTLYLKLGDLVGIDGIADDDAAARWYDLRGIEIEAPEATAHGIFIRVSNGKAEKVVL